MWVLSIVAYVVIGLTTGFLGGLLGISGGIITVPCLLLVFTLMKFSPEALMQLSIGTSLAAMVFNAISATYSHHREKEVDWKLINQMLIGLILGCIAGAYICYLLSTSILKTIFGIFSILLGFYFFYFQTASQVKKQIHSKWLVPCGFLVSTLSNILGIGGGTMMVPLFLAFEMPMTSAVGSSAAAGFIISLGGALSYLAFGLGETIYPHTIGFIYLPAFFILSITTFCAAPFGARMTHRIGAGKLKKYFAVCLVGVGLLLLIG